MSDDENDLRSFFRGGDRESGRDQRRSHDRGGDRDHGRDREYDRGRDRDRDRDHRGSDRSERGRGDDRPPRRREEDDGPMPEMYSIHKGRVMNVQSFGVFVQLEGFRKQGLVHISHISKHRVEDPKEVVNEGDSVWVKVVSLEDADGKRKLGLSMKFVNQTDGHDLDANNVDLMMSQKKTRPASFDRKPIEFGHALPTICAKCGSAGHYTKECFSSGAKYELLPDESAPGSSAPSASSGAKPPLTASSDEFKRKVAEWEAKHGSGGSASSSHHKEDERDKKRHKKEKKEKKEKKDKHHKKEKHHKKDKHEKKEKKHKHDSSSSSSD